MGEMCKPSRETGLIPAVRTFPLPDFRERLSKYCPGPAARRAVAYGVEYGVPPFAVTSLIAGGPVTRPATSAA